MSIIGKISQKFFGGLYGGAGAVEPDFESRSSDEMVECEVECELHKFDKKKSLYVCASNDVKVQIVKKDHPIKYILIVKDAKDGKKYCETHISTKMLPTFFHAKSAFTWISFNSESDDVNPIDSWSLRFPEDKIKLLSKFEKGFLEALYLTSIKQNKIDLDPSDRKYVDSVYSCEPMEVDDYSGSDDEGGSSTDYSDDDHSGGAIKYSDRGVESLAKKFNDLKVDNSALSLSKLHGRSFVVRGNNIGVYNNNNEAPMMSGIISKIKDANDNPFTPEKIMLHDRENALVMSNPTEVGALYKLDLERGIISDKWKIGDNAVVKHFVPKSKYGGRTAEQEFLGVTPNSLITIDPRLPDGKVATDKSMNYTKNNKFSCLTTTPNGHVAVASDMGVVRLYNKTNIRAKTNLYTSGEPIIGLDSIQDGRYVLATCKTHLILMDTLMPGTDNETGFTKRMGVNKPEAKRLQLRAEDAARMNCKISFLPARFSSSESNEHFIVTATGPYVIKWNLKRVNKNRLFDYTITKYNQNIVEDDFLYESPNKIVVALPKSVEFLRRSQLSIPKKVLH